MVSPLNDADFTPLWVYCTGRALTWTFWSINDLFPWVLPCFFVALWPVQRFGLLRSSNLNYTLLLCNYITVSLTVTVITLLRLPHTLTFWLCSIKRRASHTLGLATIGCKWCRDDKGRVPGTWEMRQKMRQSLFIARQGYGRHHFWYQKNDFSEGGFLRISENRGHFEEIYINGMSIFHKYFRTLNFESVGRPFESGRACQ